MAELTRGMKLVDWPDAAQDDFFGQLITQHAGSLKGAAAQRPRPQHDGPPSRERIPDADPERRRSGPGAGGRRRCRGRRRAALLGRRRAGDRPGLGERSRLGSQHGADRRAPAPTPESEAAAAAAAEVAPATCRCRRFRSTSDSSASEPAETPADNDEAVSPELAPGAQLREHLELGFSYQLNLKDQWQKVRLTYMSPARNLFLFSHGARGRETISMTARTLGRLCDAGRMRAFENAFLIDRATRRARQQLAAADARAAIRRRRADRRPRASGRPPRPRPGPRERRQSAHDAVRSIAPVHRHRDADRPVGLRRENEMNAAPAGEDIASKQHFDRWRVCVAPMMDWTDRHCRYFLRLLTPRTRLYTEMVTTGALLHGDVAAAPRLRRRRASGRAAARRQRARGAGARARGSASTGATTRSTSTAAARASACSAARSAPA